VSPSALRAPAQLEMTTRPDRVLLAVAGAQLDLVARGRI